MPRENGMGAGAGKYGHTVCHLQLLLLFMFIIDYGVTLTWMCSLFKGVLTEPANFQHTLHTFLGITHQCS